MHLASPTPSCVVNGFGMPILPLCSQSHLLFSSDGAKLTLISIHTCEQSSMFLEPQGTYVPQAEWGEALPFLSAPILRSFLCPTCSFRALPFPSSGTEEPSSTGLQVSKMWTGLIVLIPTCYGRIQTPKCPLQSTMHTAAMRAPLPHVLLPPRTQTCKWEKGFLL